jgi:hypothetical protein
MRNLLILALVTLLSCSVAPAEVADQAANGFTIKVATLIHAGPDVVYGRFVRNIGDWWSSDHTFSNDAHNLSIDDKPMGCFCEKLPGGGGVRHAEVIMVMPNKMLVLSGAFGPLQKFATTGTLTIALLPIHKDTRVELTYAVGGYMSGGVNTWAAPVDKVLTEQMARLKSFVETGNPVPAAGASTKQ